MWLNKFMANYQKSIKTYFLSSHDLHLQFPLDIIAFFLKFFRLLLGCPHFLLEDIQDVRALDVVSYAHGGIYMISFTLNLNNLTKDFNSKEE